jgi:DNA primase
MAVEVAFLVLEVLDDLGLPFGIKTTGGKGLHVVVPIERRVGQDELRAAVTRLTEIVVERRPDLVTAAFRKAKRGGRVMLDPSRNGTGATIVALYSARARSDGTVSFPVGPEELGSVSPADFTLRTVPALLDRPGPKRWRALAEERGRLPKDLLGSG